MQQIQADEARSQNPTKKKPTKIPLPFT